MKSRLRIPIRFKFMITLLVLVTAVVGFITFSTARLFQEDKQAYVHELTSMVALGTADEAYSILSGDRDRLQVFAHLVLENAVSDEDKRNLSRKFFEDFPDVLAIELTRAEREPLAVFDVAALEQAGLSKDDLDGFRKDQPLPLERLRSGSSFMRNATLSAELPAYTIAFASDVDGEPQPVVVAAWVRADRLLRLTGRFNAYETCITDSEGGVLAHSNVKRVLERERADLTVAAQAIENQPSAGVTVEFERRGESFIGGFANVEFGGLVASALIPGTSANLASRKLVGRLLWVASLLVMAAIAMGFLWAHRITRPLEDLASATHRIGKGEFGIQVRAESNDEIGSLASSFNQMASELHHREKALNETQAQLVQSEKMAAFGQLGAGIAHEVKNPLAGILASAQISKSEVDPDSQVYQDLGLIEKETKRCRTIIDNLLKFARQEKAHKSAVGVNAVIEDSVAIVNHQLELNKVKLEKRLESKLPPILGNANQLQQVFMNLMINAQQAMEGNPGRITVSTRETAGNVEVVFADDGPGMSDEVKEKLFEPFFTTKRAGKGTGLGLSVSFGMIKDHEGEIVVESEVGKGATFIITLPILQQEPAGEQEPVPTQAVLLESHEADPGSGLRR